MEDKVFIENELGSLGSRMKKDSSSIWICCPFHEERTPSLRVNMLEGKYPVGVFYCFGCGAKGNWNKLAEELNLRTMCINKVEHKYNENSNSQLRKTLLKGSIINRVEKKAAEILPEWRSISGRLLTKIGASLEYDKRNKPAFILLPLIVEGEFICNIKARMQKSTKGFPSYLNGTDANTKDLGLFPFHYVEKLLRTSKNWRGRKVKYKCLCLVEGPRDALKLIQSGIPALSILGTNSWNINKCRLLKTLCVLYNVIPMIIMDSDVPGVKAQKSIIGMLEDNNIKYKQVKLNVWAKKLGIDSLDPMDCPKDLIKSIKAVCVD